MFMAKMKEISDQIESAISLMAKEDRIMQAIDKEIQDIPKAQRIRLLYNLAAEIQVRLFQEAVKT